MTSPVDESSRVVKHVIESGAFDDIRKNIFEELKASKALRQYVLDLVEGSSTLQKAGSEGEEHKALKDRKKVLDELQTELKDKLVERASRTVWEILTASEGRVAKDVELKVHEAICRVYEEREKQGPPAAAGARQEQPQPSATAAAAQGAGAQQPEGGASLPAPALLPRPGASAASLAGLNHQQQLQQQGRAPPRRYGLYGGEPQQ